MKHAKNLTQKMPVKGQILPEGHPDILTSLKGMMEDPMGTIGDHLQKGA